jgi:hypothetical protein
MIDRVGAVTSSDLRQCIFHSRTGVGVMHYLGVKSGEETGEGANNISGVAMSSVCILNQSRLQTHWVFPITSTGCAREF